ncbi:MAG: undecaprenyl-diphosphate phosphatase [Ruminococcus sp.]|jgi:undecaprenyl-diphosphatase
MTLIESILLGLLQGITEFLPVSSSGHLVILRKLLGISAADTGILFDVMLHLGTLAAVFTVFWKDIKRLVRETVRMIGDALRNMKLLWKKIRSGEEQRYCKIVHNNYRKFVLLILISTIPTGVIGILADPAVEYASTSLLAAGIGLYVTSVMLLVVDFVKDGEKLPRDAGYWCAVVIGICQGLAVFPGVSRSGITIAACLLCGFHKKFSVKYSFIMSIPAILGAVIWELRKLPAIQFQPLPFLYGLIGVVIAGAVGYFCIRFMIKLIRRKRFKYFAGYCFFIGTVALVCHFVMGA